MKVKTLLSLMLFWAIPSSFAQLKSYSFEEAEQRTKTDPKPIVVFVHTSWCKICKMMEQSTFKNSEVIDELNTNFYFVPLDAETKRDIWFNEHQFQFKPIGTTTGVHELATALATIDGVVSYPTLTVLDLERTIVFQKNSYLDAKTFLLVFEQLRH